MHKNPRVISLIVFLIAAALFCGAAAAAGGSGNDVSYSTISGSEVYQLFPEGISGFSGTAVQVSTSTTTFTYVDAVSAAFVPNGDNNTYTITGLRGAVITTAASGNGTAAGITLNPDSDNKQISLTDITALSKDTGELTFTYPAAGVSSPEWVKLWNKSDTTGKKLPFNGTTYIFSVSPEITLSKDTAVSGLVTVELTSGAAPAGKAVIVTLSEGDTDADDKALFLLKLPGVVSDTAVTKYRIGKGTDGSGGVTDQITKGVPFMSVTAAGKTEQTIYFSKPVNNPPYAGTYTGTITFTAVLGDIPESSFSE